MPHKVEQSSERLSLALHQRQIQRAQGQLQLKERRSHHLRCPVPSDALPGGTYDHTLCGRGTDSHMAVKKRYGREKSYGHEKGRM